MLHVSILRRGLMTLSGIIDFIIYYLLSFWQSKVSSLDLTVEPWLQDLWPSLKETLAKLHDSAETSTNNLAESVNQLSLTEETRPAIGRQILSSNKFKSNENSITYSSHLAELTTLTLPPKSAHSLSIKLIESAEIIVSFYARKRNLFAFILFQGE